MILRIAGFPAGTTYYALVYNGDSTGIYSFLAEAFVDYSLDDPYISVESFALPLTESANHSGKYYSEMLNLDGQWTALVYEQVGSSPDLSTDPLRSTIESASVGDTIINNNTTTGGNGTAVTAEDVMEILKRIARTSTVAATRRELPRER